MSARAAGSLTERLSQRTSYLRQKFVRKYPHGGSNLDAEVRFAGPLDILRYLPRAISIGLWAPFPSTWFQSGERVGRAGRLLCGGETLCLYVAQALMLVHLVRRRDRLSFFLLFTYILGAAALGTVVLNAGTLYRLRYAFAMLVLIAAAGCLKNRREGQAICARIAS